MYVMTLTNRRRSALVGEAAARLGGDVPAVDLDAGGRQEDQIPLKYGEDMYITQYDAHGVESNGLLKMDFLGLCNLIFV